MPRVELLRQLPHAAYWLVSRPDGAVLCLPRSAPEEPALFGEDGRTFVEATVDMGPTRLRPLSSASIFSRWASADGRVFLRSDRNVVELAVCAEPTVRACAYQAPEPGFSLEALTIHDATWWAGGEGRRNQPCGDLYWSPDGQTWTRVPGEYDRVDFFVPQLGELYAGSYARVDRVSPEELTKVASHKGNVCDAVVGEQGTVVVSSHFGIAALKPGGKRAKYHQLLPEGEVGAVLASRAGFLLGGRSGLWASVDGQAWERLGEHPVVGLTAAAEHALVLTSNGELLAVSWA